VRCERDSGGRCNLRAAVASSASGDGPARFDLGRRFQDRSRVDRALGAGTFVIESAPGGAAHGDHGTRRRPAIDVAWVWRSRCVDCRITNFAHLDQGAASETEGRSISKRVPSRTNVTRCEDRRH